MKFTLLLAALAVAAQATDPILDIIIDSLGERPHIPDIQKAVQTFRCAAPCVQYAATQVGVPSAVCGVPKLNLEPKSICDNLDQIQAKSEPCVKKCGVSHIFSKFSS